MTVTGVCVPRTFQIVSEPRSRGPSCSTVQQSFLSVERHCRLTHSCTIIEYDSAIIIHAHCAQLHYPIPCKLCQANQKIYSIEYCRAIALTRHGIMHLKQHYFKICFIVGHLHLKIPLDSVNSFRKYALSKQQELDFGMLFRRLLDTNFLYNHLVQVKYGQLN